MEGITRFHFESLPSTHSWAKEHAREVQGLTLITADEQTAGIGQFGRKWVSPPDCNLYASFCFSVPTGWQGVIHLAKLLTQSVAEVLKKLGFAPEIRLPNDLMLANHKVGGVLCETLIDGETTLVIDSLGLNVNTPEEVLEAIDQPATSLMAVSGKPWDRAELINAIAQRFRDDLTRFLSEG